jgi:protein TonB
VPPAASTPAPDLTPVVAASAPTTSDATVARASAGSSAPSSTPPVSEARDPNSVAAVILQRVYSPDPVFPEIARERDLTGFVDLEFTVRADGTVTDVNVLKAQPKGVFENAAVDAVSKWRYRPIERGGLPINEHARLRLNFAYK